MSEFVPIEARYHVERRVFETEIMPTAIPCRSEGARRRMACRSGCTRLRVTLQGSSKSLDAGRQPHVIEAPAGMSGRIFYSDDMAGFNFTRRPASLSADHRSPAVARRRAGRTCNIPRIHVWQSLSTRILDSHRMPLLHESAEPRIWIGNAVKVNTHFDLAYNIACVAGGRRRFTLFPPEQIGNLYIAPLDFTPSVRPVSLVQFTHPDHDRFPRYAEALRHAQQAELDPGDALFIPYGWWHPRRVVDAIQCARELLVERRSDYGAPHGALLHSLLTIRDLPPISEPCGPRSFRELIFADPESRSAISRLRNGECWRRPPRTHTPDSGKAGADLKRGES
jgi:hypothetical protein